MGIEKIQELGIIVAIISAGTVSYGSVTVSSGQAMAIAKTRRGAIIIDPPLSIEAAPAFAVCSAIVGSIIISRAAPGIEYTTAANRLHYATQGRTQYTTKANRLHISSSGRTQYKTAGRLHYTMEND